MSAFSKEAVRGNRGTSEGDAWLWGAGSCSGAYRRPPSQEGALTPHSLPAEDAPPLPKCNDIYRGEEMNALSLRMSAAGVLGVPFSP